MTCVPCPLGPTEMPGASIAHATPVRARSATRASAQDRKCREVMSWASRWRGCARHDAHCEETVAVERKRCRPSMGAILHEIHVYLPHLFSPAHSMRPPEGGSHT